MNTAGLAWRRSDMPDMISHALIGYSLKQASPWKKGMNYFLIGSCLPDFLAYGSTTAIRILYSFSNLPYPHLLLQSLPFLHEPVGYGLFCLWMAQFFPEKERKILVWNLLAGALLHYSLDLLQAHIVPFYMPFFPLSQEFFEVGCIGSETTIYFIPLWVVCAFAVQKMTSHPSLETPEKS